MATGTAWYNLTKPASTENYNLAVWNKNLDEIDEQMHQNEVAATTPFTGASSSANGEKGIVPRPMAGDREKYLKGDGTWATPQGGGGGGGSSVTHLTQAEYNALTEAQKKNGTVYFVTPDEFEYHESNDGKIIVRIGDDGTKWFFNGFTKPSEDVDVPSELMAYVPTEVRTSRVIQAKAYGSDSDTTQIGWIGFLDPGTANVKIRSWTVSTTETLAGTFYGVCDIDGADQQTEPYTDPHPSGANRIYYMGTLYSDNGGGSSYHTYSTTEQIVGTWIDGSDVYERTVVINSAITQSAYVDIITNENINLLGINSDGCFLTRSNGQRWSIFGGYSGSGLLIYQEANGDIKLYNNSGVDFTDATITVTYLK